MTERVETYKRLLLTEVTSGDTVTVVRVDGEKGVHDRLRTMGIRPGARITKISSLFRHGPIVISLGGAHTALGRGICRKILVEASG